MISRIWSGASLFYFFLLPFSWVYGLVSLIIRYSYRYGWRKARRFPLPVVVIGNLTAGGNGKTPLVLWLVQRLQLRGWRVGVVSRGYGGRTKQYPLLLNATTPSEECGDEPLLIWQRTGVPVAVSPQRAEAIEALLRVQTLDVVVTDDGLQHYALARDIEWVVIDGVRRFGNGCWLPAGPMRESAARLRMVQAVIVNGGNNVGFGEIAMQLKPGLPVNLLSGACCDFSRLPRAIVAMAGIGYPARFFAILHEYGIKPVKEVVFSDHRIYREIMLVGLTPAGEGLLMTEKDAVKCRKFAHANWWYVPVDAVISSSESCQLLEQVEDVIKSFR